MTSVLVKPAVWPRTRRLRVAGNAATVVWCVGVMAFLILAAARVSEEIVSAVGVVASGFFTIGFMLKAWAHRLEWRALAATEAARRELISSTSRRRF